MNRVPIPGATQQKCEALHPRKYRCELNATPPSDLADQLRELQDSGFKAAQCWIAQHPTSAAG